MVSRNDRKEEFLADCKDSLMRALPGNEQTQHDIDDLISIFSSADLDEYVTWSFLNMIFDAVDDHAITPKNLRRYLNALRAASKE